MHRGLSSGTAARNGHVHRMFNLEIFLCYVPNLWSKTLKMHTAVSPGLSGLYSACPLVYTDVCNIKPKDYPVILKQLYLKQLISHLCAVIRGGSKLLTHVLAA